MQPIIKYFTISEIRKWLFNNESIEGLSSRIIDKQRAYAIVNNPYVKNTDVVLCALYIAEEPIAYTAMFPDKVKDIPERIWWFSTLYCNPKYQGKGYGLIVIGQLCELLDGEPYFDLDGAEETVNIFNYLGLTTQYIKRYSFTNKNISCKTLKGLIAYLLEKKSKLLCNINRRNIIQEISKSDYRLSYVSYIDDLTYNFIIDHVDKDLFVRSKDMLNWIMTYPFMQQTPIMDRVDKTLEFSSQVKAYYIQAVQVWRNDKLIGFFVYRILNKCFAIKYLYYDNNFENDVFNAITEHFVKLKAISLQTTNKSFYQWFKSLNIMTKNVLEEQSFSFPKYLNTQNKDIQLGDGDVFV